MARQARRREHKSGKGARAAALVAAAAALVVVVPKPTARTDSGGPWSATLPPFTADVRRVVDGDTIRVHPHRSPDGFQVAVRLVGIDTPETVHPTRPVECGGPEATALVEAAARPGDRVEVIPAPLPYDSRGRLLARVVTSQGDLGERLVAEGLARVYTAAPNPGIDALARLEAAQADAAHARRGVWGDLGCPTPPREPGDGQ